MRIEVLALNPQQTANTRKSLRALAARTKKINHDLRDSRIDVADLEKFVNSLYSMADRINQLLNEEDIPIMTAEQIPDEEPAHETS